MTLSLCAPPPAYRFPDYLKRYLRNRNIPIGRLSDVPVRYIREAQMDLVFENMQNIMLPTATVEQAAASPVLAQMLVTRVGSCERARGHYIPRPEGSPELVMHVCWKGRGWLRTENALCEVLPGQAFLLRPGQPHAYGSSEEDPWSIFWIHASGSLLDRFLEELDLPPEDPVCQLVDLSQLESLHVRIFREMEKMHDLPNLISASGKLYELLAYLVSERQGVVASPASRPLRQAITHMEAHFDRTMSLEEMARAAGLSVSRFSNLFKKAEGISPVAYFTRMRMQQAARLLLSSPLSIAELARMLGYEDPYYFSRVFKAINGKSPRNYRKSFQE